MSLQNIKNRTLATQGLPVDGTSIVVSGGFLSVVPGGTFTAATTSALGAVRPDGTSITVTPTGGAIAVSPSMDFSAGLPVFGESAELVSSVTNSTTSTPILNLNDAAIWYFSGNTTTITVNFTNVPTTNNRVISLSVILLQGTTPRTVTSVQIDGVTQTILWQGGTTPTVTTSKTDVFTFSLVRVNSLWQVFGAATQQG